MDAIAVTGNRIVCRSRLTGLCFFTVLPTHLIEPFRDRGNRVDDEGLFIFLPPALAVFRQLILFLSDAADALAALVHPNHLPT
jgi:hypothetical protein